MFNNSKSSKQSLKTIVKFLKIGKTLIYLESCSMYVKAYLIPSESLTFSDWIVKSLQEDIIMAHMMAIWISRVRS